MNKKIVLFVISILFLSSSALCKFMPEEEKGLADAKKWLEIVDNGEYAKSWDKASKRFKDAVTLDKWKQSLSAVRTPLGKLISREVIEQEAFASLPGAPDGSYFVILFSTQFQNKKNAIETVTMEKEKDGAWKMAGYFIK